MLSDETQHCALPQHQNEGIKIINISFPRVGIEATQKNVPIIHLFIFNFTIKQNKKEIQQELTHTNYKIKIKISTLYGTMTHAHSIKGAPRDGNTTITATV